MGYYHGTTDSCDSGNILSPENADGASDDGAAKVLRRNR